VHRALAALLALIAACGPKAAPPPPPPRVIAQPKPRLVLLIVIDQWPTWSLQAHKHLFTGGIARLLREGAIVEAAELPYANTFTAPGHATLATGAVPRETGIVGNYWYRRSEGRDRPAEYDRDALPLPVGAAIGGADEVNTDDGASGKVLRVDGVADALRAATGGAGKSASISLKSRSACLLSGRQPDVAIWYEPGAGGMTTSRAYAAAVPQWLQQLATTHPVSRYYDMTWTPRDPELLARETKLPDEAAGEDSNHGLGPTFPHKLAGSAKVAFAIQETPFADELVAHTATVAIDELQLGRDDVPDFLAVSFSAHDYAGHGWGQESWEVLDLELRLDALLGDLFTHLDARVGAGQWAVVLTSDHGATPLVERAKASAPRRIPLKEIEAVVETAFETETKSTGPWVVKLVSNNLYLTTKATELVPAVKARALEAAVVALKALPNIGGAVRTDLVDAACAAPSDVERAVCKAIVPGEAGDLYVWPVAGSVITSAKSGTGHDAPNEDNRRVPILVMAPGLAPQRGVGTTLQVAPTLAALLGVAPPTRATAQPLFGLTRR
jgi:hypothetical protein